MMLARNFKSASEVKTYFILLNISVYLIKAIKLPHNLEQGVSGFWIAFIQSVISVFF